MKMSKILIFAAVGDNCEALKWIGSNFIENNNFDIDVLVAHYGDQVAKLQLLAAPNIKVIQNKGTSKFEKFFNYVNDGSISLDEYDYFWIPDDDVRISSVAIQEFFSYCIDFDLQLAQPGCLGFAMGKQIVRRDARYLLRYTNYIDGMAPLFEKSALKRCIGTFERCASGRGIDHAWAALLGNPKDSIAIVDRVLMLHMKPSGKTYDRFSASIDEQYLSVKLKYESLVENYYSWEDKVVYKNVDSNWFNNHARWWNSVYDRLFEIYSIGLPRLVKHFLARMR